MTKKQENGTHNRSAPLERARYRRDSKTKTNVKHKSTKQAPPWNGKSCLCSITQDIDKIL